MSFANCEGTSVFCRFRSDQNGVVAVLLGLLLIPIFLAVGVAVDYGRGLSTKQRLGQAIDSAGLAAAATVGLTAEQMEAQIHAYLNANFSDDALGTIGDISVASVNGKVTISASASVETTFMQLAGIPKIDVSAFTEITKRHRKLEVALVIDNTGSMNSGGKIGALRAAATSLVNVLYGENSSDPDVKVALVPFVTSVNIKAPDAFEWNWIDVGGQATHHGANFDESSGPVKHLSLFAQIQNAEWKGCVEARAAPYDLTDDAPTASTPDTRWVPYFWPDEPDSGPGDYNNNYTADLVSGSQAEKQAYTLKYHGQTVSIDETAPGTRGPNKSCARPVLPLTHFKQPLLDEIDLMAGWNDSGTNIAQGMAWGWRVLSPSEPFTEGVAYDDEDTQKAMIVLTDGENLVWGGWDSHNASHYTSYGYLAKDRLGTQDKNIAKSVINDKVAVLCDRIKSNNILLYTITFQLGNGPVKDLMRNCATEASMYYDSPSNEQLQTVFAEIATGLSELRISK